MHDSPMTEAQERQTDGSPSSALPSPWLQHSFFHLMKAFISRLAVSARHSRVK